jgi:transcription-repair coupling factor (superfamily II helicase)
MSLIGCDFCTPLTPDPPDTIIGMMRTEPKKYQFTPDYKLACTLKETSFERILEMAKSVLSRLVSV